MCACLCVFCVCVRVSGKYVLWCGGVCVWFMNVFGACGFVVRMCMWCVVCLCVVSDMCVCFNFCVVVTGELGVAWVLYVGFWFVFVCVFVCVYLWFLVCVSG